ncbi:hypothetical protein, partial [Bartonella queenslandensis]|uniref:hypothetical protein n=1 Tax=Bartonella queenslandensis TaxID=481138 RepID=UPI001AEBBEFE
MQQDTSLFKIEIHGVASTQHNNLSPSLKDGILLTSTTDNVVPSQGRISTPHHTPNSFLLPNPTFKGSRGGTKAPHHHLEP